MNQFCYIFKGKDQDFGLQDMPKHIQKTKAMIISFKNITQRARQIFHAYSLKAFDRSYGYALHAFHEYSLKNLTRAKRFIL